MSASEAEGPHPEFLNRGSPAAFPTPWPLAGVGQAMAQSRQEGGIPPYPIGLGEDKQAGYPNGSQPPATRCCHNWCPAPRLCLGTHALPLHPLQLWGSVTVLQHTQVRGLSQSRQTAHGSEARPA